MENPYTERWPTRLCTCPTKEVTINDVTYQVDDYDHGHGDCPTHGAAAGGE